MKVIEKVKDFFSKEHSKKIYEEIWAYFEFHKEINKYFNEGVNYDANNSEQEIYFVDYNWIRAWKRYTNYENVITMDKNYEFLKENGFLEYNENHNLKGIKSGNSYELFLRKTFFKIDDFDCLIDKATYDYFKKYKDIYIPILDNLDKNLQSIKCIFFKHMLVLLILEENTMKIIYKNLVQSNLELFQFNLLFKEEKKINDNLVYIAYSHGYYLNPLEKPSNYNDFRNYIKEKKNRKKLISFLSNKIDEEYIYIKEYKCTVTNLIAYKRHLSNIKNKEPEISLNNSNNHRLIGLQNIGATCYMNATLQCFVNLKQFTNYLLNKNNFFYIHKKIDICEVLGTYCRLLQKLCCDKNVINYYAPEEFKNIISLKNPLFEGIKANDSKDLIYFLLEQMNYELNQAKLKINPNLQKKENQLLTDQTNKNIELSNFIQEYSCDNNNIIPKLFFSLIENESLCLGCNIHKYNFIRLC